MKAMDSRVGEALGESSIEFLSAPREGSRSEDSPFPTTLMLTLTEANTASLSPKIQTKSKSRSCRWRRATLVPNKRSTTGTT